MEILFELLKLVFDSLINGVAPLNFLLALFNALDVLFVVLDHVTVLPKSSRILFDLLDAFAEHDQVCVEIAPIPAKDFAH